MRNNKVTMKVVLYVVAAVVLGGVQGQECPHNNIQFRFGNDPAFADPLVNTLCLRCGFSGNDPFPSDTVWSLNGNTLTNGSMNGQVLIDPVNPNQNTLIILNPDNILNVGDTLRCSSASIPGEHTITISAFVFENPTLSPDGGSDMTIDVTEGTNLTLSCRDPGNTGTTRYQWFDDTGNSLTGLSTTPPLALPFANIQRNSSGLYICQSTKANVPGVIKMSNITINVQYPAAITSISPLSSTLPRGAMITINCSFDGNPPPENVTWERNGTILDPNTTNVNTQTMYSELILTLQGLEDSGSYMCVTENIIGIENSSEVNITVQVSPSPVAVLNPSLGSNPSSSVMLTWSYGFNGNADIIGVNITYKAIGNNENPHSGDKMVLGMLATTISDLQPLTTYNFTVVVHNTVSNIVGTSTPVSRTIETAPLAPNAPTLNSVTAMNSTALRVSWTDNRDPFTQTPVQSFTVTYVPGDQSQLMLFVIVLAPSTTVDISDLMKGTYYNVIVYANNSVGRSLDSNTVTTRTDIDPPLAVSMLRLTSYPVSLCASWQPPSENGGQNISSYQVYVRNDDATPAKDYMLDGNLGPSVRSYRIEPLMNSTTYSIRVAATNIEGGQGPNTTMQATTGDPIPVESDITLTVSDIIALQATVNWTLQSSDNKELRLQYRLQGQDWSRMREINFTSNVSQYMYTNLSAETFYEIRLIRIGNDNCLQRTSPTVNFTTLELKVVVSSTINGSITAGNGIVLVCNLDTGGAPPTSVTWRRSDGVPIPSDVISGNVLNITNPQVGDTANYTCSFRDTSYTFSLIVNPVPTSPTPASTGLPDYAIYIIAGGVAVIIIIFIMVLIIVLCCVCRGKKDNKKYNVKKPKKTAGGMWLDEGASGYMPSTMSTNPTYRHTSADTVEEQRGRSLTGEQVTATSFNTLDKNDDRSGSQDKLTDDKYADIEFGTKLKRPYDEQRVEYATVGHTSFTAPQQNAIQTDV